MNGPIDDRRSGDQRRASSDRRGTPDRRTGFDRRRDLPEKPFVQPFNGQGSVDRRSGKDRRSGLDNRYGIDRRSGVERRIDAEWLRDGLDIPLQADTFLDLVADFYSASMDGRFWPTALAKLREALAARVCALAAHDFGTGQGVLEQVVGLDAERVGAYAEYWGHHNPCLQREAEFRQAGAVWTEADLAADEAAAGEFAQHWLMPQDLRHQMFGVLERTGNRMSDFDLAIAANAIARELIVVTADAGFERLGISREKWLR